MEFDYQFAPVAVVRPSLLEDTAETAHEGEETVLSMEHERIANSLFKMIENGETLMDPEYELSSPASIYMRDNWAELLGIDTDPVATAVLYRAHSFAYLLSGELVQPTGIEVGNYYSCVRSAPLRTRMESDAIYFFDSHPALAGWLDMFMDYIDPEGEYYDVARISAGMTFKHIEMYHHELQRKAEIAAKDRKYFARIVDELTQPES